MADKERKSAKAKAETSSLQAALKRAKEDIAKQVAAKTQAAYFLNLLSKDDLTGEVKSSLNKDKAKQPKLNEPELVNSIVSMSHQYKEMLQKNNTAKQNVGRLKQIDMHPLLTSDFMHQRHHANRSLGSEILYNSFMRDKQKPTSSLNKSLMTYLFADSESNAALTNCDEAVSHSKKASSKRNKDLVNEHKYAVRLYMVSQHCESIEQLQAETLPNNDKVCSQATWSNPGPNQYKLCWKELSDPSLYSEYTELLYDAATDELSIVRPGEFYLKLDFKKGLILQSNYHTPYGDIPMITETKELACDVSQPDKGSVRLLYFLSNDNQNGHYVSINLTYRLSQAPLTKEDLQQV